MRGMIVVILAAALTAGCGTLERAPKLIVAADRPGCSTLARAFLEEDGGGLSAEQVLNGVAACEARDRAGAVAVDPAALNR